GPESYGRIAVLWAALFVVVVVLFRPLEQTTARALAERRSRGERGTSVVRAACVLAATIAAALVTVLVLGRDAVGSALFDSDATMTWALVAGIVIYGATYVVRGVTSGIRWFGGYGLLLLADGIARVVLAIPLLVVASEGIAATAMVGAGVIGILFVLAVGTRRLGRHARRRCRVRGDDARARARVPLPGARGVAAPELHRAPGGRPARRRHARRAARLRGEHRRRRRRGNR